LSRRGTPLLAKEGLGEVNDKTGSYVEWHGLRGAKWASMLNEALARRATDESDSNVLRQRSLASSTDALLNDFLQ